MSAGIDEVIIKPVSIEKIKSVISETKNARE